MTSRLPPLPGVIWMCLKSRERVDVIVIALFVFDNMVVVSLQLKILWDFQAYLSDSSNGVCERYIWQCRLCIGTLCFLSVKCQSCPNDIMTYYIRDLAHTYPLVTAWCPRPHCDTIKIPGLNWLLSKGKPFKIIIPATSNMNSPSEYLFIKTFDFRDSVRQQVSLAIFQVRTAQSWSCDLSPCNLAWHTYFVPEMMSYHHSVGAIGNKPYIKIKNKIYE